MAHYSTIGTNVIPSHYTITFESEGRKFQGQASIAIAISKATKVIKLHAKELEIHQAFLQAGTELYPAKITLNPKPEELALHFPHAIRGQAILNINFTGTHNDAMYGFYRSEYQQDGKFQDLLTTQFEAANARACFPCFDEPAFKATFDVSLIVDAKLGTISNMPIKEEHPQGKGKKKVTFQTSPRMSTYLLYLGVGDFKSISTKKGVVDIRVFTTPDKIKYAPLALEYTKTFLSFFEDYFKIKYPLPKLDIIAIPDFASGAMENWGAITFREIAVLGDENTSVVVKQNIAITIAHELAHQWFGNLVTMQWWDDLWLNESFATFMSYKAVHAAFPQWDLPLQYFYDTIADALSAVQLESTHPINVVVKTPGEVDEIFDRISYDKGGSVLHMLEDYVGEEHFRAGLTAYLTTFAYKNATKQDLWKAIQKAHRQEGIATMMNRWITLPGYPGITVASSSHGFSLRQHRFTLRNASSTVTWPIPVSYQTHEATVHHIIMDGATATIAGKAPWVKLNDGQHGFYRAFYSPDILQQLGRQIGSRSLSALDAAGIENDVYAAMLTGRYSLDDYLSFVRENCLEAGYPLNESVSTHLSGLNAITYGKKRYAEVRAVSLLYHTSQLSLLGGERKKEEKNTTTIMRSMTLASLGLIDHPETLLKIKNLLTELQLGKKSIDPNLRGVIYSLSAWQGDEKTWTYLVHRYQEEHLPEEARKLLRALGMFQDKALLQRSLEVGLSSTVRLQDSFMIPMTIGGNPAAGFSLLWNWTKHNWKTLMKTYSSGTHMLSSFVHNLAGADTKEQRQEIKAFFARKENDRDDIRMAVRQVLERIDVLMAFMKRNGIE
ncbi:TPA: M1 family metallopeptidase [Candidatus Woesearchaeota archaeon]|nr:M1 family metallopeptidase [Candidatus Woesearchaeota archaeon]